MASTEQWHPLNSGLGGPLISSGRYREVSCTRQDSIPKTVHAVAKTRYRLRYPDCPTLCILFMMMMMMIIIIIILFITFTHSISNYIPVNKPYFYGIQCCSCSVFTVCATCNVISPVKYVFYFYVSTSRSVCPVHNIAVCL